MSNAKHTELAPQRPRWLSRRLKWSLCLATPVIIVIMLVIYFRTLSTEGFRAAGCYLPLADGIVLGINRSTNTVQLPIGRGDAGELARITAARETLEETGIAVNVGARLLSVSDGTVHIFLCRPQSEVTDYSSLKPNDRFEVKEVLVLDPVTLINFDGRKISEKWRHDKSRSMIKWLDLVIPRVDK